MWSQMFNVPQLPLASYNPPAFCDEEYEAYDNEPINAQNASIFVDSSQYAHHVKSSLYDSYMQLQRQQSINQRSMTFAEATSPDHDSSSSSSVQSEQSCETHTVPAMTSGPSTIAYTPHCDRKSNASVGAANIDNNLIGSVVRPLAASGARSVRIKAIRSSKKAKYSDVEADDNPNTAGVSKNEMAVDTVEALSFDDSISRKLEFSDSDESSLFKDEDADKPYDRSEHFTKDNKPRQRAKRRKVTDISNHEVWHCSHEPCEQKYKRTSSISINRHKEICTHRPGAFTDTIAQLTSTAIQAALTQNAPSGLGNSNEMSNMTIASITQLAALQTLMSMAGLNGQKAASEDVSFRQSLAAAAKSLSESAFAESHGRSSSSLEMSTDLITRQVLEAARQVQDGVMVRASSEHVDGQVDSFKRRSLFSMPPPSQLSATPQRTKKASMSLSIKSQFELDCSDLDPATMFGMSSRHEMLPMSPVSAPNTSRTASYDQLSLLTHPLNSMPRPRLFTPQPAHVRAQSANFSAYDYRAPMSSIQQWDSIDTLDSLDIKQYGNMLSTPSFTSMGLTDGQELFSDL